RIEGVVIVPEGSHYTLEINGHKLRANRKILDRIRHLETYTIYYLERSKVILSMEPIEAEDNLRERRLVDEVDVYEVDAKQKQKHKDYR
ncbi:MAG: hypothetical protein AAFQ07_10350, partial [Chloroflexota bacterium]